MSDSEPGRLIELIDFGAATPSARLSRVDRIGHGDVAVSHCVFAPNPGAMLGATQCTVAIHEGDPYVMEWRPPEKRQTERCRIAAGDLLINPGDRPLFLQWAGSPKGLVIALEPGFIAQVASDAFDGRGAALRTAIGAQDPVIAGMAQAWRRELSERGAGGRILIEALGVALAVHLVRTYGDGVTRPPPIIGGLGARRLRQAVDYMETHLAEDISLGELAALVGLSTHHFGEAFKASTGRPPHRYLIERRVHRGKERLLAADQSIAEIAVSLGFVSHSHFTCHFRKVTGTTPSRFRRDRR